MKTRNGKIARLAKAVRDELNCRLSEGEPGTSLVEWLNGRDDVKKLLAASFGGRLVSEQALSEWRAGGYQDWPATPGDAGAGPADECAADPPAKAG
jgi:hypothetical protein